MKVARLRAEDIIYKYLPEEKGYPSTVVSAINYSVKAGGKRIRPIFMYETFRLFGGEGEVIEPFMAAIEMIHNYSLVHDDLEAMDNDEFRRGRKTTHVIYGEGMAVLAGDGLLNLAFETALKAFDVKDADTERVVRALKVLAGKSGLYGMLGGQACDVDAEQKKKALDIDELMYIHENKTGALIQSAMMIGAILAGASDEEIDKVSEMALLVGTAFQIEDDILDVEGDEKLIGKRVGSDEKNNKITYVTLKGIEEAKKDAKEMSEKAIEIFDGIGRENDFLRSLIISMIGRTN
ncbi:MAG: polyprenyl synthetase family protein [Lachnospiraceae bacterium]|nr:polyprenyl synthetase family protein [Lachnospiraceae bacterium]MBR1523412.1 polyprenyl synthetase family protein [Lachnospiraceae bacterium]